MTGFPLEPSKTVTFSRSITNSSVNKALSHLSRKRLTSYNPGADASANSWSLCVSESNTNTLSNWSIVSCFGNR